MQLKKVSDLEMSYMSARFFRMAVNEDLSEHSCHLEASTSQTIYGRNLEYLGLVLHFIKLFTSFDVHAKFGEF